MVYVIQVCWQLTADWFGSAAAAGEPNQSSPDPARKLSAKPVWHIPLMCVQWKTPDGGQRNCPKLIEFYSKNKFEKLVYLVGFIIRINAWFYFGTFCCNFYENKSFVLSSRIRLTIFRPQCPLRMFIRHYPTNSLSNHWVFKTSYAIFLKLLGKARKLSSLGLLSEIYYSTSKGPNWIKVSASNVTCRHNMGSRVTATVIPNHSEILGWVVSATPKPTA